MCVIKLKPIIMNMKINKIVPVLLILVSAVFIRCSEDFPIDEDGLLITTRTECYVSSFELLGTDHQTVRASLAIVDTVAQTIDVEVKYGTNLKYLWPQFSLCEDAKLDPKVTGYTDFSDLDNPRQYTVVSGNRNIRKTYVVRIYVQPL
jgi:hypothetical protein